ncbi:MAG TPA: hypothetical protein VFL73_08510 [Solirubrobacteraceae bacterium]|jgi:hypothetical protein|nr:hypothetical protein [Solirubrobacteraceae bacterium]
MTRFGVGLASVLMCAILAAPADAPAAGNGLYSPFPTVAARKRAERFVNRLRAPRAQRPVSRAELDHGSFNGHALTPVASGGATARASDAGGVAATSVWIVMAVLAAACAIPAALRRRSA